jgi:hypothetical protein
MKSIFLILVLAVTAASADIGTDFVVDNILKPLGDGIYQNTVGWLIGEFFNLLRPSGKRSVANVTELVSQVSGVFNAFKEKMSAVVKNAIEKFQLLAFNILTTPGSSVKQVLSEAVAEMRAASFTLLTDLSAVFQSLFGQKFLDSNTRGSRNVFGNISNILNEFTQLMEQTLGSYAETLSQAAVNGILTGNFQALFEQFSQAAQAAVQQLTQAIAQIGQISA